VVQLGGGWAVPRPRTPAYPVISAAFAQSFRDVRDGAEAGSALTRAAVRIDREVADNDGYPFPLGEASR
jgi:multiple sugar transport system substrate-binding protein